MLITAVNWGEVVGKIYKSQGRLAAEALTGTFELSQVEIIAVDVARAARSAILKIDLNLGYADAICVELAQSVEDSLLLTADYDFQAASGVVDIEFLPLKPKP